MTSQCTKFEVTSLIRYDAMNGDAKCRKWGGLGQLRGTQSHRQKMQKMGWFGAVTGHSKSSAMSPFDRAHTTSYSTLIETMRPSCTVFEI